MHVQGNCQELDAPSFPVPPTHAPLRPLAQRQCVLLADEQLMRVDDGQLWLDRLYIRLSNPRDAGEFDSFLKIREDANLWMTTVTLQGNGDGVLDCFECGLSVVYGAQVFGHGMVLAIQH